MRPLKPTPPQSATRLSLQATLDQVVAAEAHSNERNFAYVRAVVLFISSVLDVAVFLFPQPLMGEDYIPPTVMIISLCASLFALGLVKVLQRPLSLRRLRQWQLIIPVFDSLLLCAFITNIWKVLGETQPLILTNIAAFCCLIAISGGIRLNRRAAWLTTLLSLANFTYAAYLFQVDIAIALFATITIFGTGFLGMWMGGIVRRHIKNESGRVLIERFLPRTVVETAFESPLNLLQQPKKCDVTVVVADLRSFTQYSEHLDPQAVLDFLNRYQGLLATIVEQHGGWVDKFMGDGMLAVFGAPEPLEDHAEKALTAAIAMAWEVKQMSPLAMGIGIHSGQVVAGCLGSVQHLEFTVIGDTVNVASRIEALTKTLGYPLLVSRTTQELITSKTLTPVGFQTIRGRVEKLELFTLS